MVTRGMNLIGRWSRVQGRQPEAPTTSQACSTPSTGARREANAAPGAAVPFQGDGSKPVPLLGPLGPNSRSPTNGRGVRAAREVFGREAPGCRSPVDLSRRWSRRPRRCSLHAGPACRANRLPAAGLGSLSGQQPAAPASAPPRSRPQLARSTAYAQSATPAMTRTVEKLAQGARHRQGEASTRAGDDAGHDRGHGPQDLRSRTRQAAATAGDDRRDGGETARKVLDTDKAKHPPRRRLTPATIEATACKIYEAKRAKQPPSPVMTDEMVWRRLRARCSTPTRRNIHPRRRSAKR